MVRSGLVHEVREEEEEEVGCVCVCVCVYQLLVVGGGGELSVLMRPVGDGGEVCASSCFCKERRFLLAERADRLTRGPLAAEMEEAYNELYQEFLRLRSLCLRQAALLHQLTAALQKQQGAAALPNGDLNDMMSIAVQCTHEIHENPQARTAAAAGAAAAAAAAHCGSDGLCKNMGTVSDLLAEDMSLLCVDSPLHRQDEVKLEEKVAPLFTLDPLDSSPGRADHLGRDRTRMLAADRPSLVTDFMSLSGGMLMSDVVLQSHVCDFCQAVFPRDSTTKGEFLRHLHTHVP